MVIAIIVSPLLGHHLTQTQIGGLWGSLQNKVSRNRKSLQGRGVSVPKIKKSTIQNLEFFFNKRGEGRFSGFSKMLM